MIKLITSLIIIVFSLFIYSSCSKNNGGGGGSGGTTADCSTVSNKAFTADVNPIIQSTCAVNGCHASGSINGPGALTNYSLIFNARNTIRSTVLSGSMPKNSTLSTSAKNSIICWIDSGAPNN